MAHNIELFNAFNKRNLGKFKEVLEIYEVDPNFYLQNKKQTMFEYILSTPGSSTFIKQCIKYGADFYVKDRNGQYPLHHAIQSNCIDNLRAVGCLLTNDTDFESAPSPCANVKNRNGQNGLHLLAEGLNNENFDEIFPMMKVLLSHGCNSNYPDINGKSPFFIVLEKLPQLTNAKEIFEYFMKHADVDFYSHRSDEIIQMTKELQYLEVLPTNENVKITFDVMMNFLKMGEINRFETSFQLFKSNCDLEIFSEYCAAFLETAIELCFINVVDILVDIGINVNRISKMSTSYIPPLFLAYLKANVGIFKTLLSQNDINLYCRHVTHHKTILHQFFEQFAENKNNSTCTREMTLDEKKCFDLLMEHPKSDRDFLNATNGYGLSVIYYSVLHEMEYMTRKLLERGAYIGPVVSRIRKNFLIDFLDSCITSKNNFQDDKDFEIRINYQFLQPPTDHPRVSLTFSNNDTKLEAVEVINESFATLPEKEPKPSRYKPEMGPLEKLATSKDNQDSLMHPVLASFIFLKWIKIRFLVHLNLVLTLFYMLTFVPFVVISRDIPTENSLKNTIYSIFYFMSFISVILIAIREILQYIISPKRYLLCLANWIDIALILASIAILLNLWVKPHQQRMLQTSVILLSVWEYFNLLGYLPIRSVSLYTKIFRKVFTTFLTSLAFYSVLILGFALSFYTLHGSKFDQELQDNKDGNKTFTKNQEFNNFHTVGLAFAKSFVMFAGELDAANVNFDGFTYSIIFLTFTFIVTIVLYNLLNGLAVSDAHKIISDAKLIDLQQRTFTMHTNELSVFSSNSLYGTWFQKAISMFPDTFFNGVVCVRPNKGRFIYLDAGNIAIINDMFQNCLSILNHRMMMNEDTIEDMCKLLLKKHEEKSIHFARQLKEKRYEKLTKDIIKINGTIYDIQKSMSNSSLNMK